MSKGREKREIHHLHQGKSSNYNTTSSRADGAVPPETAAAVASKKEGKISKDKDSLIDSHLATPPQPNTDNDKETETDSESNKETTEKIGNNNHHMTFLTSNNHNHHMTFLTMLHQQEVTVSAMHLDCSRTATAVATQGLEMLLVWQREHSMFINCIPATCKQLGADVEAKICSVIHNTLFKSANSQPSHVVGICLYDGNFCLPGLKGDLYRTKHWDAVQSEIIFQTSIL